MPNHEKIIFRTSKKIIHAKHLKSIVKYSLTKMRADKSISACYQYFFHGDGAILTVNRLGKTHRRECVLQRWQARPERQATTRPRHSRADAGDSKCLQLVELKRGLSPCEEPTAVNA